MALGEIHLASSEQLGWRHFGSKIGTVGIDFLLYHQHLADEDGSSGQQAQVAQVSLLDEVCIGERVLLPNLLLVRWWSR